MTSLGNKTVETDGSVVEFLNSVSDSKRREDCFSLLKIMQEVTGEKPKMWGTSIVGFGSYHYKYASGREGDSPTAGFSPRKQALTIYIVSGLSNYPELLTRLGKFTTSKGGCLYVKRMEDLHIPTLKLIKESVEYIKNLYK